MEDTKKIRSVLEKLKTEYTSEAQNILIQLVEESLMLIESAKKQMNEDSEKKDIPFGFDKDRFGQMRQHSGVDIIKTMHYSIRSSLKQLEGNSTKSQEKPKSKLANLKRA